MCEIYWGVVLTSCDDSVDVLWGSNDSLLCEARLYCCDFPLFVAVIIVKVSCDHAYLLYWRQRSATISVKQSTRTK
jgi:hypothetical protein